MKNFTWLYICVHVQAWVREVLLPLEASSSGFRCLPGITASTGVFSEAGYRVEALNTPSFGPKPK